jgi:PQQ-dependent dehydrogenase (s-GDH family)
MGRTIVAETRAKEAKPVPPEAERRVPRSAREELGGVAGSTATTTVIGGSTSAGGVGSAEPFVMRIVASALSNPWEVTYGPDGYLWITERTGKRVSRVRPTDGRIVPVATLEEVAQTGGQDGLLGMALHPNLLRKGGPNHVYVAYTYDENTAEGSVRRTKIRRFTYLPGPQTLADPVDVIARLPSSSDHNSGRLAFGPDGKLYYTLGDQGNNQFDRKCNLIRAQELPTADEVAREDWSRYVGKVLRLEPDGSIPTDNPVLAGVRSHVYSYGHRNAQGIVFSSAGRLYASEHGPKTDDELNWILPGRNYGWPLIAGYQDDQAYVYANWSASSPTPCSELEFSDYEIPPSVPIQRESDAELSDFKPPLRTFYTVDNDYSFRDPACAGSEYICWPTIAPSSIDSYPTDGVIAAWRNTVLLTSLKQGSVFVVHLSRDGRRAIGATARHLRTVSRYRDLALSPDGARIYVATDNAGATQPPTGGYTTDLQYRGAILEFRYTGKRNPHSP